MHSKLLLGIKCKAFPALSFFADTAFRFPKASASVGPAARREWAPSALVGSAPPQPTGARYSRRETFHKHRR
jgi:hypothetical protein